MRCILKTSALVLALAIGGVAFGGEGPTQAPQQYGPVMDGGDICDPCDPCAGGRRHHHDGLFGRRRNQESGFNCGCNGSYKFPVPPLYTYHWPGMYSAQLMTDYHSPWRFPPLKPYADEIPPEIAAKANTLRRVQPASAVVKSSSTSQSTSFSSHLEGMLR